MSTYYPGQRLSTKGERCTIRYIGPVKGKPGQWLGVEWDDATRGKHSGTHDGVEYFTCKSNHPTAGSFLRPTATWDKPKTFLEALKYKYAAVKNGTTASQNQATIMISGKEAEEVGFEKIARQQAQLQNLKIVVLDDLLIKPPVDEDERKELLAQIEETCPNITELDLGRNLFEGLDEVADICDRLPKLRSLKLEGNRLRDIPQVTGTPRFAQITSASLDHMLLTGSELESISQHMPNLKELSASSNQLGTLRDCNFPSTLTSLTLEDNDFTNLHDILYLGKSCTSLQTLNLKNNQINSTSNSTDQTHSTIFPSTLTSLDLSYNAISTWTPIDHLPSLFPSLHHLRIAHNPLFTTLISADSKPLSSADGYMLTIARLPLLLTLNYSKITDKERLNSETYYLSQISRQLSLSPKEAEAHILTKHPRWKDLCEEYGEPVIQRRNEREVDPNSLAARLVECSFYSLNPSSTTPTLPTKLQPAVFELPKACSIYTVLGAVGRRLGIQPSQLKLILETGEKDRVDMSARVWQGIQEWDSDIEDAEEEVGEEWREREIELVAGTRLLGTYVEGTKARFRVEVNEVVV